MLGKACLGRPFPLPARCDLTEVEILGTSVSHQDLDIESGTMPLKLYPATANWHHGRGRRIRQHDVPQKSKSREKVAGIDGRSAVVIPITRKRDQLVQTLGYRLDPACSFHVWSG